ncbi:MAG: zinc-binding dehydrogenase [Actinomyces urogenitalis]|nr:zinc-binding dehydrogenase [Actinomyces urogenitalis]MBS6072873.1 zinc-binding dehydrogenase [Actinomyces urogenitalis]
MGGYAVQLAHRAGIRLITTASPAKTEAVRALGADEVIDYRAAGSPQAVAAAARAFTLGGRGVDGVLDTVDAASATANLTALAFNGALAYIGGRPDLSGVSGFALSPSLHEISLGAAYSAGTDRDRRALSSRLARLLDAVAAGSLDARVQHVVSLEENGAAYAELASGPAQGKTVCQIG